ncbi:hypothetical protein K402DRAFT_34348 [Aulographum hederae CBS 113979]|uniref:Uncharacterized protein n=1 Tax=Aulographum hederae CBS 113979 TaxID=1176131 RepID=A0A6G1H5P7_9PEZI|nr:hypothetical protein K402DRAFT_34348 [Aulographum hederae CBS 113979]
MSSSVSTLLERNNPFGFLFTSPCSPASSPGTRYDSLVTSSARRINSCAIAPPLKSTPLPKPSVVKTPKNPILSPRTKQEKNACVNPPTPKCPIHPRPSPSHNYVNRGYTASPTSGKSMCSMCMHVCMHACIPRKKTRKTLQRPVTGHRGRCFIKRPGDGAWGRLCMYACVSVG